MLQFLQVLQEMRGHPGGLAGEDPDPVGPLEETAKEEFAARVPAHPPLAEELPGAHLPALAPAQGKECKYADDDGHHDIRSVVVARQQHPLLDLVRVLGGELQLRAGGVGLTGTHAQRIEQAVFRCP